MRIKQLRELRGIKQKDFAASIGIAPNTLSQYETGKRQPDPDTLKLIAAALHVSVDELLGVHTHKAPPEKDEHTFTFDDFTFAMHNESKLLTQMDKQLLLSMAKQLNDARKHKNGESQ